MSGGRFGRVVLAAALACACGGVSEQPGREFSVRVLDESPIRSLGLIYAPVRIAVDGCAAFDLELEDTSGARRSLTYREADDGSFVASVPVAWIRDQTFCGSGFMPAVNEYDRGTLVATCHDAGRSATADFALNPQIGVYWETGSGGEVRAVFPGDVPLLGWWIATSPFAGEVSSADRSLVILQGQWAPVLNPASYLNSMVRPRLVRNAGRAFATLGCETFPTCPQVSTGPGESAPGERLADFVPSDGWLAGPRGIAHVSTNVIDMAFTSDGALVVVSDSSVGRGGPPQYLPDGTLVDPDAARWGETIVWRVTPAPEGSQGVVEDGAVVLARFRRETTVSRLSKTASGSLAFLTVSYPGGSSDVSVNLHVSDGTSVTTSYTAPGYNWLPNPTFVDAGVFLSPDGSTFVTTMDEMSNCFLWMDTASADHAMEAFACHQLVDPRRYYIYSPFVHGGAVWLPDALALWGGGDVMFPDTTNAASVVQVYEAASPHAFRYEYVLEKLPGAIADPILVGATAVGDHLVLTTTTGIRVLDAGGSLVGGADPLPCGVNVTATAEPIGPHTVAFGVGGAMVAFQVGPSSETP